MLEISDRLYIWPRTFTTPPTRKTRNWDFWQLDTSQTHPLLQLAKTESQDPVESQDHVPLQLYSAHIGTAHASSDSGSDGDEDGDNLPSSDLPDALERALNQALYYVFSAYSQMSADDCAVYYAYMRPLLSEEVMEVTMEIAAKTAELLKSFK
ncbi:hypothetical protein V8E36_003485 [Tilletia maclaganii]